MTNLLRCRQSPQESNTSRNDLCADSPDVAALLLTNVATIASNELNHRVLMKPLLFDPSTMSLGRCGIVPGEMTCACLHYDYGRSTPTPMVSSDDENHSPQSPMDSHDDSRAFCQPISSSHCLSAAMARKKSSPLHSRKRTNSNTNDLHSRIECVVQKPRVVREVLPKKFSWKNYPEVSSSLSLTCLP